MGLKKRLAEYWGRMDKWAENHRLPNWLLYPIAAASMVGLFFVALYLALRHDWIGD